MTDKFEEIAAAFQQSEDVRVKTKRELLAPILAKRKEARAQRNRQIKCRFTAPFGHYYDDWVITGDRYARTRCVHCLKMKDGRGEFESDSGTWFTAGMVVGVVFMAFLWWLTT